MDLNEAGDAFTAEERLHNNFVGALTALGPKHRGYHGQSSGHEDKHPWQGYSGKAQLKMESAGIKILRSYLKAAFLVI